uniref:riboflavin kinase n=1 Tax=Caenorhabditis japonica TaxID=281687 RepID=A0A8R1HIL5_CAEJA
MQILPYRFEGEVVRGFGRGGKELGCPTANMDEKVIAQLPDSLNVGVYYGKATLDGNNDKNVTDVSELVQAYSSHILHTVSLACSSSEDYLLAPQLLQGYMKFAEIGNNFDHFKVIIEKMLYALDTNEQEFTQSILRALFSFMAALCRQYEDLLPYEPPEDAEDQKEIATPQHIITEKVLLRTKQMLLSPHLPIRISCLEILAKGLELLKNYDDALLPMIHQNWHGIMTIVKENEPMSMAEAFEVVVAMSKRSGTFVHGKVLNEFWPKINGYLINIVKKEFIFQHTADYRLVVKVISQISELIINLQLKEEEANDSFIAFLDLAISENRHFAILSAQQKEKIVEHFRKNLGASADE